MWSDPFKLLLVTVGYGALTIVRTLPVTACPGIRLIGNAGDGLQNV